MLIKILIPYLIPLFLFFAGLFEKKSRLVTFLLLLYFWILMGLNTNTPDWISYKNIYERSTDTRIINIGVENAFRVICAFFYRMGLSYQQFRMVWAAIYSLFAYMAAKRLSPYVNYVLAMFLLWPAVPSVSGIRNAMSGVIVCFAIPYLFEDGRKGALKYAVVIILSSFIHASELFFLLMIPARGKLTKKRRKKIIMLLIAAGCLIKSHLLDSFILALSLNFPNGELALKIHKYLSAYDLNLNFNGFSSNAFFVVMFAFLMNDLNQILITSYKKNLLNPQEYEDRKRKIAICKNISFYMLFVLPGYLITSVFTRFTDTILMTYYAVFAEFTFETKYLDSNSKIFYKFIIFFLVIWFALLYMYSTGSHDVPATFRNNILFQ